MFINATALVLAKNGYVQERCGKQGKTWRHHVSTQSDTSPSRLVTVHHDTYITVPALLGILCMTFTCFTSSSSHMTNLTVDSRRISLVKVQSTIRVRKHV